MTHEAPQLEHAGFLTQQGRYGRLNPTSQSAITHATPHRGRARRPVPHTGCFLTVVRDDAVEPNLVWSDTVLARTGETVDILLEVTNPGRWMAHCHIAEHHDPRHGDVS